MYLAITLWTTLIMKSFKEATDFDSLYESMWKCRCGKMWKASVARYVLHGIENTIVLSKDISVGKYKPRKPHTFVLTYPKLRPCSSIHIRDRVVQRSINDNIVYPVMTKDFVYDNFACQKGKGTTKAMDRIDQYLHRFFINQGLDGYVLQFDIKGYYRNMAHDISREIFSKLDKETLGHCMEWLENQYPYDVGFEPGSQMVQILGISFLNDFDHFAKETLKAKYYLRYMDEGFIISDSKEYLEYCKNELEKQLSKVKLFYHPDKTKIYPLSQGIKTLGFTFKLTKTGKVIRTINPKNVKHERKKLKRMAELVKNGEMSEAKMYECYKAWKAHAELGNSYKLLKRMDVYVNGLLEGEGNAKSEQRQNTI